MTAEILGLEIRAQEPRILLDAAALATAAETVAGDDADSDAAESTTSAEPESTAATDEVVEALAALEPAPDRTEVVFIDAAVSDYQTLISGIVDGVEVVILAAERDGVVQIADYLDGRADIDAIQIISHGDVGEVRLGNTLLDASNLDASQDAFARIGASLTETGDILLYGCKVGADGAGQSFIDSIADLTGADIAASDDLTGSSALGGDWVLEKSTGPIEAANAVGAEAQETYSHILAAPVAGFGTALDFDGTNDFVDIVDITGAQLSGAVTFEAWVNFDTFSSFARIVDIGGPGGESDNNIGLFIVGTTGKVQFIHSTGNGAGFLNSIRTTAVLPLNTWVHVAGVTDGTNGTIYINGVAQPLDQHITCLSVTLRLGRHMFLVRS